MGAEMLATVRTILLEQWDPIGIRDVPAARDEYDRYAPGIVRSLRGRTTVAGMAAQLLEIETEQMGLAADRERAERVARTLLRLVDR